MEFTIYFRIMLEIKTFNLTFPLHLRSQLYWSSLQKLRFAYALDLDKKKTLNSFAFTLSFQSSLIEYQWGEKGKIQLMSFPKDCTQTGISK